MINNIKYNWLLWMVGIIAFAVVSAYGCFCWYAVQAVRAQGQQIASVQLVPISRVMERVITQSIAEDGAVTGQSVKDVIRIRYSLNQS